MIPSPASDRAPAPRVDRLPANVVQAVLWMLGALVSFSLVAVAGREASRQISTVEIMFWRNVVALAVLLVVVKATGGALADLATRRPGLHLVRNIVHFAAQFAWLSALTLIPLAQLFALEFTAPLWVVLLAPLFLAERLTTLRVSAAAIGFVGALVVIRPFSEPIGAGASLALASALGFALSMLLTKRLVRGESTVVVLFYMTAMQMVFGLLLSLDRLHVPDAVTLGWAVLVGLAGLSAHFSLTKALTLADSMIVAPLDFLRLPLIALVGVAVYDERLDPLVLAGGVVILAANGLNLWGERRARKTAR